jgi:cyclopropane-fatty-acyl-phospholipid synthase
MARYHGVRVKAFNISRDQIAYARRQAAIDGLSDRVEFIEDDYRNAGGRFDAFVSVGMLEHVGAKNYADFGRAVHRTIGDRGRGLLHFIGRNRPSDLGLWIQARIFPGAYAPALGEVIRLFEPWDYSVIDVENLRLHYARTLEHWLERFEQSMPILSRSYSEEFLRAWRLYLAGSLVAFRVGTLQLFHILFAGKDYDRLPLTRDYHQRVLSEGERFQPWKPVTS